MNTQRVEDNLDKANCESRHYTFMMNLSFVVIVIAGLFAISRINFLFFHGLAELFSIAVGWSVFLLVWNAKPFIRNDALVFLGIACLFTGFIDGAHTLTYKGMGIFPDSETSNYATQLWIAARGIQTLSLLLFPILLGRQVRHYFFLFAYAAVTALVMASIFAWDIFPVCYVEGTGLTTFKITAEYVFILTLIGSIVLLFRKREQLDRAMFQLMIAAIVCMIFSELFFTFYISVYGFSNLMGHYLKILSFILVYLALIRSGLTRPYATIFRELEQEKTALENSEDKFSKAFKNAPLLMTISSLEDGRYLEVNDAFVRVAGYKREKALGATSVELGFITHDDRNRLAEILQVQESIQNLELKLRCEDGSNLICLYSGELVEIEGQTRLLSIANDITARKQAEEALRSNEARLKALWSVVSLTEFDLKTICDHVLQTLAEMTQSQFGFYGFVNEYESVMTIHSWNGNAMKECSITDKPCDFLVGEAGVWAEAIRRREPLLMNDYSAQHPAKHGLPEGHVPLTNLLVVPFFVNGKITAVAAVANKLSDYNQDDVTQITSFLTSVNSIVSNKQTGEALQENEARLKAIYDGAMGGFLIADPETQKFIDANDTMCQMLGYSLDEIKEMGVTEIHPEESLEIVLGQFEKQARGDIRLATDTPVKRKDGSVFYADINASLLTINEKPAVLGIFRDITERKQADDAIRKNEAELLAIYENAPVVMILLNSDRQIIKMNKKGLSMAHLSMDEVSGLRDGKALRCINALNNPRGCGYGELCQECGIRNTILQTFKTGQGVQNVETAITCETPEGINGLQMLISTAPIPEFDEPYVLVCLEDITERKTAEMALEHETRKMNLAADSASIGVWDLDLIHNNLTWDKWMYRLYGIEPEDFENIYEAWQKAVHPDDRERTSREVDLAILEEQTFDTEFRIIRPDGDIRYIKANAVIVKDVENTPLRMIGINYDITESKRAEQKLRNSETRIRTKLDALLSPEGDIGKLDIADLLDLETLKSIFKEFYLASNIPGSILDMKGNVLIAEGWQDICTQFHRCHPDTNQNCLESGTLLTSGVAHTEYKSYRCKNGLNDVVTPLFVGDKQIGKLFLGQFFYEDDQPNYEEFRERARRYGFDETAYLEALDRVPRWNHEKVDHVMRFYSKFADLITRLGYSNLKLARTLELQRIAEEGLRNSENKFRTVANFAFDWEYWVSPGGEFLFISPSCERITLYSPEEFIQNPKLLDTIIHPGDRHTWENHVCSQQETKLSYFLEFRIVKRDGSECWLEHTCQPVYDDEQHYIGYRASNRDISDRKLIERERAELETQFLQVQKLEALGTLAGGVAHDFNNILAGVIGFTQLAMGASDVTDRNDNLQSVLEASTRAKNLVKQILTFSRKNEARKSSLAITPVIKEALKLLRSALPTSIDIQQHIHCDVSIFGDLNQIHQVVMNLCTNAGYAMREKGGTLEIELKEHSIDETTQMLLTELPPGDYVRLVIRDTGNGIPEAIQNRIFDPFFTTKEKSEGTGLGLSVVFGIVKNHQGGIEFESIPETGTTFSIYFPVCENREEIAEENHAVIKGSKEWILFVDDEEMLRKMIGRMLESIGYNVVICKNGQEALARFQEESMKFNLVLTDQTMPKMTGIELSREILKINPTVPIILYTGYDERITPKIVLAAGVREMLYKPLTMEKLSQTISKVLTVSKKTE